MLLLPRKLGSELTLDDYNACQYMLYEMNCWKDTCNLGMIYDGYYARYNMDIENFDKKIYTDKLELIIDKIGYMLNSNATATNRRIYVKLSEQLTTHRTIHYTLTYAVPYTQDGVEISAIPLGEDVDEKGYNNLNAPNIHTLKGTLKKADKTKDLKTDEELFYIELPTNKFKEGCVIYPEIQLDYKFNDMPTLDIYNGEANTNDEILLDNVDELDRMITHTDPSEEKTIYRLDANKIYTLNKTIILPEGTDIEIRGGSNRKTVLNGSKCGRLFIVPPNTRLTLHNLELRECDCRQVTHYQGMGGAILVKSRKKFDGTYEFGVLETSDCDFKVCTAKHGGAIYAYHGGLYVHDCKFYKCSANMSEGYGGAISYRRLD